MSAPLVAFTDDHFGVSAEKIFHWDSRDVISLDTERTGTEMFIEEFAQVARPSSPRAGATISFDARTPNRLFLDVLFTLGQSGYAAQVLAVDGGDGRSRGFIHAPPRGVRPGSGDEVEKSEEALSVKIRGGSVALENVQGVAPSTLCWEPKDGVVVIPHRNNAVHTNRVYGCARAYAGQTKTAIVEGSPGVVFDDIARTLSALSGMGIQFFQFKLPRETSP